MKKAIAIHRFDGPSGTLRVRVYSGQRAHVYDGRKLVFRAVVLVPTVDLVLGTWTTHSTACEVMSLHVDGYSTRAREVSR